MMKCIAIDDEPLALDLIAGYIRKTPFLELKGAFTNPFHAMSFLQANQTELIFLDIQMPELTGLNLIKALTFTPRIIFTTAFPDYGAESYEYNAIDYLLKPIKYERFLKAVNKAIGNEANKRDYKEAFIDKLNPGAVLLKSGTRYFRVLLDDIYYIEADGNYMTFFTRTGKIMCLMSMNEVLNMLPESNFVRIHKSFIVSLKHIEIAEKTRVIIKKTEISVGITYREHFSRLLKLK
jgi:DNA-binding LytR/AlgR family response regulator